MATYTPKGWRKLFPYYWRLGRALERRDEEMEYNIHREVDRAFAEMNLQHIQMARKNKSPAHVFQRIELEVRDAAEKTHRILESRGIKRPT